MRLWTREAVAQRLAEAAHTARQLPRDQWLGYDPVWPTIRRQAWEAYAVDDPPTYFPPSPAEVDRLLEAMRWMQWLSVPERHLLWQRAQQHAWCEIARRFHCDRTTAWRRWQHALDLITVRLNACRPGDEIVDACPATVRD